MNNFISGISYFIDGVRLVFQPGLRRFVILPCLINIILFFILFILLAHYINVFNLWFENHLPNWLQWMGIIVWLVFLGCFILIFLYTFILIANLIAAPFNGLLAEKVELFLTGNKLQNRSLSDTIKDVPRIIGRQLAILVFYLPYAVIIFIFFFVPVIQSIAMVAWFIFNAWFVALMYVDFPTDNHRVSIQEARIRMRRKMWSSLGFGVSVLVAMMIPIFNFIAIPAAVAGATKFWLKELA